MSPAGIAGLGDYIGTCLTPYLECKRWSIIFQVTSAQCRGRQAFTDICKGLFVLHANKICHLDMKTANVLISNDGTCKISDMGLSKMLGAGNTNLTAESMGTLAYISPEQICTGRAGLPADIWALSTILWEVRISPDSFCTQVLVKSAWNLC